MSNKEKKTMAQAIKEDNELMMLLDSEKNKSDKVEELWKQQLQRNKEGKILSNAFNVKLILTNDEKLKDKFAFNRLTMKSEVVGKVPWKRLETKAITDFDDSCLRNYLSIEYGIKGKELIFDCFNEVVMDHQYHPVRDYLHSLEWDGVPRLDSLLIDFFEADDTELNRWQTRLTFIGAVARAFEPGCKFDYVLTLKGEQGLGKSTFLEKIAVNKEWFTDSLDDIRGKDGKEQIQGKWIIELGEMAAVSKGDQKRIKQFITSTADEFRQAYGRRTNSYPRQCIFVATTNDELPLKDDTGGRRWWIVDVKGRWFDKDISLDEKYINQVWAEAVYQYEYMKVNGKSLSLSNELEEVARKIQSDNTDKGLYASEIEFVLERGWYEKTEYRHGQPIQTKKEITETCALHVWIEILGRFKDDLTKATAREINATLKNVDGWECIGRRQFGNYGKQTVYKRINK